MTAGALKRGLAALLVVLTWLAGVATAQAACAVGSPGATVSVDAGATGRPFLLRRPPASQRASPRPC